MNSSTVEEVSIHDLNHRLKVRVRELKIPYEVSFEITYGCNLRCVHCYNPTHQALSTEWKKPAFCRLLEELVELGCMVVSFTGGEPLTRPDAFELFFYAKRLGLQINLYTNATLIDEEKIRFLKELQPTLLSISVYGMTRETYEGITRVPGSFDKFMCAFDLLKDSGLSLQFKMPVMTLNVHELDRACEWFREHRLPFIHSLEIHPRVDGNTEPLGYRLSPDLAASLRLGYQEEAGCLMRRKNPQPEFKREEIKPFSCACGKLAFALSPYGEMNLCVTTHYPKYALTAGNLKEGWNVLVRFVEDFRPTDRFECPACEFAPHCTQGMMDAWLNTGDFNPCVPYFKDVARRVKTFFTPSPLPLPLAGGEDKGEGELQGLNSILS